MILMVKYKKYTSYSAVCVCLLWNLQGRKLVCEVIYWIIPESSLVIFPEVGNLCQFFLGRHRLGIYVWLIPNGRRLLHHLSVFGNVGNVCVVRNGVVVVREHRSCESCEFASCSKSCEFASCSKSLRVCELFEELRVCELFVCFLCLSLL